MYNPPPVVSKFLHGSSLIGESPRDRIRNFAYYVFKIDPILGTGMGNFPNLNHDDIKELVIKDKGVYDKSVFMPYAHPHNVYLAYLSGGGIILFSIFIWFWLQIVNIIYQVNKYSNEKWLVFNGAGVVLIVLGIGWVNTTLAHEHALITMFVLGLLVSRFRQLR
jgi:O-antigen ligase